jgi:mono/diheme cytochrome c family protein
MCFRPAAAVVATFATASMLIVVSLLFPVLVHAEPQSQIDRGRYLVTVGSCNVCHTQGFAGREGQLPESQWLTGASVGYQGPWGTSYPTNLRLSVASVTQEQWIAVARAPRLPPMPWFALRDMSDDDLRAIYHFIRSLGPKGERAPAAVRPGGEVKTPFIVFTPQNLPKA